MPRRKKIIEGPKVIPHRIEFIDGPIDPIRVYSDYGYGLVVQVGPETATLAEWKALGERAFRVMYNDKNAVYLYGKLIDSLWQKHGHKQPKAVSIIEWPILAIAPAWARFVRLGFRCSVTTMYDKREEFSICQPAVLLEPRSEIKPAADGIYEIERVSVYG